MARSASLSGYSLDEVGKSAVDLETDTNKCMLKPLIRKRRTIRQAKAHHYGGLTLTEPSSPRMAVRIMYIMLNEVLCQICS